MTLRKRSTRLPHEAGRPVRFRWNGREIEGRDGDTVAAALHAAGIRGLACSRKKHWPLGYSGSYVAGVLARVDGRPNVRLDLESIRQGARVESQNHWPGAAFDILSLMQLVPARWLRGGFEHPNWAPGGSRRFAVWERLLAFLAGVAKPPARDLATFAKPGRKIDCGALVIGGGPAGCAAANSLAAQGIATVLATRGAGLARFASAMGESPPKLDPRIELIRGVEVFGLYREGTIAAAAPIRPDEGAYLFEPGQIVLAVGARSMPPLVPGSHVPGVMDAHTALNLAHGHAVAPGQAVLVVGNDNQHGIAGRLRELGVNVVAIEDVALLRRIHGRGAVIGADVGRRISCDAVVHGGPWREDPSLAFQAGASGLTYLQAGDLPKWVSRAASTAPIDQPIGADASLARTALVCPCMDVTAAEILDLIDEGETHPEVLKRLTSCGMGPCQGMPCWEIMTSLIASATGKAETEVRRPAHRGPRRAISVAQAAGMVDLLAPER